MTVDRPCPDCASPAAPPSFEPVNSPVSRRQFVRVVAAAAAASAVAAAVPSRLLAEDSAKGNGKPASEGLVKKLYESLDEKQRAEICFPWDHTDDRGLLRLHVRNNWHITKPVIASDFYTKDQQELIEAIFHGLYNPDWIDRIHQQIKDDAGEYGKHQNVALFGTPGSGKFEFVMTGRHLTIRCDGDSNDHFAFGGPIFYGHAAQGFDEKPDHPGNVFWHQALKANALYQMLNGKQREMALVAEAPAERQVHFQGKEGKAPGIPVSELSKDQKEHMQKVIDALLEPYRLSDRDEAAKCLTAQGGLDSCRLAFFKSGDLGDDGVWDVWRIEGPSFVWHFRGSPHVHVWVNVASDPAAKITTG